MSYNITTWRTKELKDFRLPVDHVTYLCHIITDHNNKRTYIDFTEGTTEGRVEGDWFIPDKFELRGTWSGNGLAQMIESVFPYSKGKLVATLIWEGGDTIERLTVEDGKITRKDIDV